VPVVLEQSAHHSDFGFFSPACWNALIGRCAWAAAIHKKARLTGWANNMHPTSPRAAASASSLAVREPRGSSAAVVSRSAFHSYTSSRAPLGMFEMLRTCPVALA
jgi:hypothetical protein